MPTYAVLGATGSTGSCILRYLHERDDNVKINIYARSATKVHLMHPFVSEAQNIQTFIGDLDDPALLLKCLRHVDVVFSAVAQNKNEVGCSVAQQTAQIIVTALESLRASEGTDFQCPTLIFLSSATLNPIMHAQIPWIVQWMLDHANYYVYSDLAKAIQFLQERSWIPLIIAEPPALVQDVSRGHQLTQTRLEPMLAYEDLARGMVAMAEERGSSGARKWVGENVGVSATGKVQGSVWPLIKLEFWGLITYYFHWP